jgi:hypothetical protein
LLSDKVLDEFVVIDQLLIINLGPALQFHLIGVILPLDLDLDEREAHQLEHLVRVSLELHAHMEGAWLLLLSNQLLLVLVILAEGVLWVAVTPGVLVPLIVQPLGISLVLKHRQLALIIPLKPLVNLIHALQVGTTHGHAPKFLLKALRVEAVLVGSQLGDHIVDLLVLVNDFLNGLELSNFLLLHEVILFLAGDRINLETLAFKLVMLHELICTTIVGVSLVKDVLADLVKSLGDVKVKSKQCLHNLGVDLGIFVV